MFSPRQHSLQMQASATRINSNVLHLRDFQKDTINPPHAFQYSGLSDSLYFKDFQRELRRLAGPNGTVLQNDQFIFMQQQTKIQMAAEFARINQLPQATQQDMNFVFRYQEALLKEEKQKQEDNEKSRACITLIETMISSELKLLIKPVKDQHPNDETAQLKAVQKFFKDQFPVTAYDLKKVMAFDLSQIGIAQDASEVVMLGTAFSSLLDREYDMLTQENPATKQRNVVIAANNVALAAKTAEVAAYHPANEANRAAGNAAHPPRIEPFVLPYPYTEAIAEIAVLNLLLGQHMEDSDANLQVDPVAFVLSAMALPPIPPARSLLDDSVQPMSRQEVIAEFRDRLESSIGSKVSDLRKIVVEELKKPAVAEFSDVLALLTAHIAANPESNNHQQQNLHAALASRQGQGSSMSANNAEVHYPQDPGLLSQIQSIANAAAYGGQVSGPSYSSRSGNVTRDQSKAMTDEQLGSKRRAELEQQIPCHFFGMQSSGIVSCSREDATGHCDFKAYHDPNYSGPPAKQWQVGGIRGGVYGPGSVPAQQQGQYLPHG